MNLIYIYLGTRCFTVWNFPRLSKISVKEPQLVFSPPRFLPMKLPEVSIICKHKNLHIKMISSKLIYQYLFGLVALSMRSSVAIATPAPTPAPTDIQPEWVPFYNTGTFASEDDVVSNAELVEIWSRSPNQLIHRKCPACTQSHQDIYYRRFDTNGLPQYMDLLSTMTETWSSFGNQEILGQTFKLYSTYNDAINNTNAWTYCNYDLEGVGFPRECGVTGHTGGQYNSMNLPSYSDIAFYVEALPVTSSPTEAPTASPTPAVSVFMNEILDMTVVY